MFIVGRISRRGRLRLGGRVLMWVGKEEDREWVKEGWEQGQGQDKEAWEVAWVGQWVVEWAVGDRSTSLVSRGGRRG